MKALVLSAIISFSYYCSVQAQRWVKVTEKSPDSEVKLDDGRRIKITTYENEIFYSPQTGETRYGKYELILAGQYDTLPLNHFSKNWTPESYVSYNGGKFTVSVTSGGLQGQKVTIYRHNNDPVALDNIRTYPLNEETASFLRLSSPEAAFPTFIYEDGQFIDPQQASETEPKPFAATAGKDSIAALRAHITDLEDQLALVEEANEDGSHSDDLVEIIDTHFIPLITGAITLLLLGIAVGHWITKPEQMGKRDKGTENEVAATQSIESKRTGNQHTEKIHNLNDFASIILNQFQKIQSQMAVYQNTDQSLLLQKIAVLESRIRQSEQENISIQLPKWKKALSQYTQLQEYLEDLLALTTKGVEKVIGTTEHPPEIKQITNTIQQRFQKAVGTYEEARSRWVKILLLLEKQEGLVQDEELIRQLSAEVGEDNRLASLKKRFFHQLLLKQIQCISLYLEELRNLKLFQRQFDPKDPYDFETSAFNAVLNKMRSELRANYNIELIYIPLGKQIDDNRGWPAHGKYEAITLKKGNRSSPELYQHFVERTRKNKISSVIEIIHFGVQQNGELLEKMVFKKS